MLIHVITCLAWLYRKLCQVSNAQSLEIVEPLMLLQVLAYDRFSTVALQVALQALIARPFSYMYYFLYPCLFVCFYIISSI